MKTLIVTLLAVTAAVVVAQQKRQCPTGFELVDNYGICVKIGLVGVNSPGGLINWNEALDMCKNEDKGSTLARPDSPLKMQWLSEHIYNRGYTHSLWVDASKRGRDWYWGTGLKIPTTSHLWEPNHPLENGGTHVLLQPTDPENRRHYLATHASPIRGYVCQG